MWPAILAGAMFGKSMLVDKPREEHQRQVEATKALYSPWTGIQPGEIKQADPLGAAMQGAMLGLWAEQLGVGNGQTKASKATTPKGTGGKTTGGKAIKGGSPYVSMSQAGEYGGYGPMGTMWNDPQVPLAPTPQVMPQAAGPGDPTQGIWNQVATGQGTQFGPAGQSVWPTGTQQYQPVEPMGNVPGSYDDIMAKMRYNASMAPYRQMARFGY